MKKNTHDEQEVSNLLKQLQQSFAEPEKPEKAKKKKADDVDDQKFQEKLAAMLGKLTQQPAKKSRSRKPARPAEEDALLQPDQQPLEEAVVEATVPEEAIAEEPIIEEPIVEEPAVEEVIVEEPTIEEPVVEEPAVEDVIMDDAVVEEIPVVQKPAKKRAPKKKKAEQMPVEESLPTPPVQEEIAALESEPTFDAAPTEAEIQEDIQEVIQEVLLEEAAEEAEELRTSESQAEEKDDVEPQRTSAAHPLERIVPLSPVTDEEEDEPLPPPPAKEPVSRTPQPTEPVVTAPEQKPAPQMITIAKPQVDPHPKKPTQASAAQPSRPVVIKPKSEPLPSASPRQADPDTIVIRPRTNTAQAKSPIVIQPPTAKKSAPAPRLQQAEAASAPPIKIGKESRTQVAPPPSSDPRKMPTTKMKQKPNTTIVPPTAFAKHDPSPASERTEPQEQPLTVAAPSPKKTLPSQKKKTTDAASVAPMQKDKASDTTPKKPNRTAKKRASKPTDNDEQLSAMDLVRQHCGLSEDDVAMIFELGYENELGRLVGYDNLRQLKNEHLRRTGFSEHKHYRTAFGYRGEEYAGTSQRDAVTAAYLHDRKPLIARVLLTALCTLLLLFLDLPSPDYGVVYMPLVSRLLSLALLGGCAALSARQIVAGLHSFFKFTPTPYSVPALLVPVSMLYGVVSLFIHQELFRVGFLTALVLLLVGICDLLRFSTEMRALKIVSTDEPKIALATAQPRKKKLRVGNKTVKIINDDIAENRYAVRATLHTVGHFRRFNNMRSASRPFAVFAVMAAALSTLAAFVCAIATSNVSYAISDFMTVLLLTTPVSAVFSYFYPLYLANRLLATRGCALIGDEAVTEYDGQKTVVFRDTDLYTAQRSTEIAVRSGDALRRDMTFAAALFQKLGGTLGQMAEALPAATDHDLSVTVTRVQENGIEAQIDNRYQILLGNAAFLTQLGVKVPKETTDSILRRASNVGLVYFAIDGSLRLSYEVEYRAERSFERVVRHLAEAGCVAAISSYDPNLDEVFLQKSRPNAYASVSVLNPGRFEEDKPAEFTDTGAVAQKSALDIAYPLYAAAGIARLRGFAYRIQLIASLLGTLLVTLLTLLGNGTSLSLFAIVGIQLFWTAVVCLATHSELNGDKLHFRKHSKKDAA